MTNRFRCVAIKRQGFTIVELLVVIVAIGVLAAITVVSYIGISQRATISSLQSKKLSILGIGANRTSWPTY